MKNILKIASGLALVVLIAIAGMSVSQALKARANVNAIDVVAIVTPSRPNVPVATTSPEYLVPGTALATSTKVVYVERSDFRQLNVMQIASSSTAVLGLRVQFSNDPNCSVTANCNWFEADQVQPLPSGNGSVTGFIDTASSTVTYRWNGATTTTNWIYKSITLPSTPARYMRLQFFAVPGGTNTSYWAEVALKSVNNQ